MCFGKLIFYMESKPRFLTALPVYNEKAHVNPVLDEVVRYAQDVLVVDDGSTDGTRELLEARTDVKTIRHEKNCGYGAALKTAFEYAVVNGYEVLVTIDCDGQHTPQRICSLVAACKDADFASGSRYLCTKEVARQAPPERRQINTQLTRELNERLGLAITDSFCGFKAYRVPALAKMTITEPGYGMPIEVWVQAAYHQMKIVEVPVPLIYLDEKRSFGGALDDGGKRMEYYHRVLDTAVDIAEAHQKSGQLPGLQRDAASNRVIPVSMTAAKPDSSRCGCS